MDFPIYFYLTLLVLSPWPIIYSCIFYYRYKFDTTFEYYISKEEQLYKFWAILLLLPLVFLFIFMLRYNRIGISLDLIKIIESFLKIIAPLRDMDLCIIGVFVSLFIVTWILILRVIYQYFRKCLLALYLYYHQYRKIKLLFVKISIFRVDYNLYLWNRVEVFTSSKTAYTITRYIWPIFRDILERNLYFCLVPYLIVYDFVIQQGVISKIFIILPWYYVYSLIRFALKFFYAIHKPANWKLAEEMYGYPK